MKIKSLKILLQTLALIPFQVHADLMDPRLDPTVYYDEARVIRVEPIRIRVKIDVPEQECRDREVVREYSNPRANVTGSTLAGGMIGGIIGNSIGRGKGRPLATIGGAILGATIAGNAANHHNQKHSRSYEQVTTIRECRTVHRPQFEERVDGFQVDYEYRGNIYQTRMPYRPSNKIRVRISIDPVAE